jgi:hypothetical protein
MRFSKKGRMRPVPLRRPSLAEVPLPDPLLLRDKSSRAEVSAVTEEAVKLTVSRWGLDETRAMLRDVLPRVITDPSDVVAQTAQAVGKYAHFGFALAEVERRRGWERPGQTDGRVRTALVMWTTVGPDVPDGTLGVLASYLAQAGYWVGRMGGRGLAELRLTLPPRSNENV